MDEFKKYLRKVINRAGQEAQQDSSNTVEAQHLLLAIAAQPEPTTRSLLTEAGLDLEAIRAALDQEFERSLSAVGVSRARYHLPRPSPRPQRAALGRSAKLAVERGVGEETRMRVTCYTCHRGQEHPATAPPEAAAPAAAPKG